MRIFNILDRFDEKIKLFKLDSAIIKIWRIDEFIGVILRNERQQFDVAYVIVPRELEFELDDVDLYEHGNVWDFRHGITFNDINDNIIDVFEEEWFVGFDYGSFTYLDHSALTKHGILRYRDESLTVKISDVESLAKNLKRWIKKIRDNP